jgi:hypothetical protein
VKLQRMKSSVHVTSANLRRRLGPRPGCGVAWRGGGWRGAGLHRAAHGPAVCLPASLRAAARAGPAKCAAGVHRSGRCRRPNPPRLDVEQARVAQLVHLELHGLLEHRAHGGGVQRVAQEGLQGGGQAGHLQALRGVKHRHGRDEVDRALARVEELDDGLQRGRVHAPHRQLLAGHRACRGWGWGGPGGGWAYRSRLGPSLVRVQVAAAVRPEPRPRARLRSQGAAGGATHPAPALRRSACCRRRAPAGGTAASCRPARQPSGRRRCAD